MSWRVLLVVQIKFTDTTNSVGINVI